MGATIRFLSCLQCFGDKGMGSEVELDVGEAKRNRKQSSSISNPLTPLVKDPVEAVPVSEDKDSPTLSPSSERDLSSLAPSNFHPFFSLEEISALLPASGGTVEHRYQTGDVYTGQVRNRSRHGTGTMQWALGAEYSGNWVNGLPSGTGTMEFNRKSFSGLWRNHQFRGEDTIVDAAVDRMEDWLQAYNDGYGKHQAVWLWYNQRLSSKRPTKDGNPEAMLRRLDNRLKAFELLMDTATSAGEETRFIRTNGYFGCGKNGIPDGIGRRDFPGGAFCQGEWRQGDFTGTGKYQWSASKVNRGEMNSGKLHGFGVQSTKTETVCGLWTNGRLAQAFTLVPDSQLS